MTTQAFVEDATETQRLAFTATRAIQSALGLPERTAPENSPEIGPDIIAAARQCAPQRPRWSVLAGIIVLHGALIAGLMSMQYQAGKQRANERLTTISLTPPPQPPSPVSPSEPVSAASAPVVAPAPQIALSRPLETVAAPVPTPIRVPPVALAAQLPLSATPQPVRPPAPAPLIPPDFSASQLANRGPTYPFLSRKAREEGVVLLRVLVSATGTAARLAVETSSGFARLDESAMKTVRKWRFVPASQAGQPREAWVLVPVTFSLG